MQNNMFETKNGMSYINVCKEDSTCFYNEIMAQSKVNATKITILQGKHANGIKLNFMQ